MWNSHGNLRQRQVFPAGEPSFSPAATRRHDGPFAKKLMPDVVVMDIATPLLNGPGATPQISKQLRISKRLILTSSSADEYVQQLTEAVAACHLVKQSAPNDQLKA